MICAVYTSWFSKRDATWSPCHMKVIDVIDDDIQRVARSLAKSYGKLEDCTFTTKGSSAMDIETLHSLLKIGQVYTKEQLTEVFAEAGAPKAKVSCLKQWFEIRNTKVNGKSAYRIIRKL